MGYAYAEVFEVLVPDLHFPAICVTMKLIQRNPWFGMGWALSLLQGARLASSRAVRYLVEYITRRS
jgi:hypothetical protein